MSHYLDDLAENAPAASWLRAINTIKELRQELAEIDGPVFPVTHPGNAATSHQLDAAEQRLGYRLDNHLRELLGLIDGWPGLIFSDRLMSTEDLGQGPVWASASEGLDIFYEDGPDPEDVGLPAREELMPFAMAERTVGIHAIWTQGPTLNGGHPVFWFMGSDIECYDNISEYFLNVVRRTEKLVGRRREKDQEKQ